MSCPCDKLTASIAKTYVGLAVKATATTPVAVLH